MDNRPEIDRGSYTVQSHAPREPNGNAHRDFLHVSEGLAKLPKIQNAADLQKREFPEIRYIVPGIIAPGLTLFSGRPKIGKSWCCLDVALAVAGGRYCLRRGR